MFKRFRRTENVSNVPDVFRLKTVFEDPRVPSLFWHPERPSQRNHALAGCLLSRQALAFFSTPEIAETHSLI
jgi:hypothetical protein